MITSKYIIKLSEEYFSMTKTPSGLLEIYVNPTPDELLLVSKESKSHLGYGEIRFFAVSQQKKVYVFDAYLGMHYQAAPLLHLPSDAFSTFSPNLTLIGKAKLSGKSAEMTSCDVITSFTDKIAQGHFKSEEMIDYLKRLFAMSWSWCDKYVKCSSFMKQKKQEFEKLIKNRN